jgi:HNH/ENDO VII superfamily nuclease
MQACGPWSGARIFRGLIAGTGIAYVPGGFLAAPVGQATGVLKQPTKTFQFFEGAGEAATGAAQIFGGLSGEVGGTALDLLGVLGAPESLGTSLAFTAAGVTLNVASWALIAQGAGNVAGGLATSAHALFRTGGEDLPEGTHSIVEHPDQPVGTGASTGAEILAENLENAGEARPSQYHEAHHIVPENDARADTARTILQNAGIDVNDSNNGVWLARTSRGASSPSGITGDAFSSHDSIHTNVYMNELTDRLEWAQATDTVYETMQSIKIEIELGIFPH